MSSTNLLHDMVSSVPGTRVMGHQGEQQWTQDTALRGAGAQGDDTGGGGAEAKGGQFAH